MRNENIQWHRVAFNPFGYLKTWKFRNVDLRIFKRYCFNSTHLKYLPNLLFVLMTLATSLIFIWSISDIRHQNNNLINDLELCIQGYLPLSLLLPTSILSLSTKFYRLVSACHLNCKIIIFWPFIDIYTLLLYH